ncbi:Leucine Rich repeats (2 copies) [Gimesia alba]|uniref:Leucine Rich repeats (2 copies) n=1 Tax=Gimesia alba TaxID=2527973 RepID=A0A517RID4_9PLAN|nr:hypothetical protein [Gimesia alba]QDT43646.1 Leucine Rich repeats (2 copies) [Gimesia alba]
MTFNQSVTPSEAITAPPSHTAHRKRIVAAVAGFSALAVLVVYCSRTRNDQIYITQLENLGAIIGYEDTLKRVRNFTPRSARRYLPTGPHGVVTGVGFFGPRPTDADLLLPLSHLPNLRQIQLSNTLISDEILKPICRLQSLFLLQLESTKISDNGVKQLSTNRSITHLFLDNTPITDTAVIHLAKMGQLDSLSLSNTSVTDESVEHLLAMPHLRILDVTGTQITSAGINRLKAKGTIELCTGLSSR